MSISSQSETEDDWDDGEAPARSPGARGPGAYVAAVTIAAVLVFTWVGLCAL